MTTGTPISSSVRQQAQGVPLLDPEVRIKLYETMVLSRTYEEALLREHHADKGPGFDIGKGLTPGEMHLSAGQEPVAAGVCAHLTTDDAVTATHRPHHFAIAHGVHLDKMTAEIFGRETGLGRGRGGHRDAPGHTPPGRRTGPFEVESALMEPPAVVDAGVIGKPDPIAGEVVKAFVTLRPGFEPSEALARELVMFGRKRLGSVTPREIAFDQHLPHTRSGELMRRLLKARELGLPEGDVSTLEGVRTASRVPCPGRSRRGWSSTASTTSTPRSRGCARRRCRCRRPSTWSRPRCPRWPAWWTRSGR